MATVQTSVIRSKDVRGTSEELRRKLFLERMERKLAFKEAIYNKLYRRRRPFGAAESQDSVTTELAEIPSE